MALERRNETNGRCNEPSARPSSAACGLIRLRDGRCPIISDNPQYAGNEPRRSSLHAAALTKNVERIAAAVRELG